MAAIPSTVHAFRENFILPSIQLDSFVLLSIDRRASMAIKDNSTIDARLKNCKNEFVTKVYQTFLPTRLWFFKLTETVYLLLGSLYMEWSIDFSQLILSRPGLHRWLGQLADLS